MRWVICALFVLGFAPHVFAADLDILRGSESVGLPTYNNWTGFYAGGQWGYNDGDADFSKSTAPPIAYQLRNTALEVTSSPSELPVLGTADHAAMSYGAFVGYNSQWANLILGVEANLNHETLSLDAPTAPIARSGLSDGQGNTYTIAISGSGTLTNLNYAELRGRAGWILGDFLPYAFLGGVIGVADVNVNATVLGACQAGSTPTCAGFSFTATGGRNSAILYGGVAGGGLDYALTQNVFLRGEFEYVAFVPFEDVAIGIASARVGAGVKF